MSDELPDGFTWDDVERLRDDADTVLRESIANTESFAVAEALLALLPERPQPTMRERLARDLAAGTAYPPKTWLYRADRLIEAGWTDGGAA